MWGISWQNLQMMLIDLPYTDYSTDKENEVTEVNTMEQHRAAMKRLKAKRDGRTTL